MEDKRPWLAHARQVPVLLPPPNDKPLTSGCARVGACKNCIRKSQLPVLLLMTILAESLLPLVRGHLMALPLLATGHLPAPLRCMVPVYYGLDSRASNIRKSGHVIATAQLI